MAFLPGNLRLRVKELRTQHNMTQEELASILGVDKGTVSRLEKEPEKGEEKSPRFPVIFSSSWQSISMYRRISCWASPTCPIP